MASVETGTSPTSSGSRPAACTASAVQRDPSLSADSRELCDGLHRADLVVRPHHGGERGVRPQRVFELRGVHEPIGVHPDPGNLEALGLEVPRGLPDGGVLDAGDDDVPFLGRSRACQAKDRQVVCLGAAAGEEDLPWRSPDHPGYRRARPSTASRAAVPEACREEGLPRGPRRCDSMASRTRGSRGVVAALSR